MRDAHMLSQARRSAGLTQRRLAERAGVPQSTVGRIEAGTVDPRLGTIRALLRACDSDLEVMPRLGVGIDRSQIRERLAASPLERIRQGVAAWNEVQPIIGLAGRAGR